MVYSLGYIPGQAEGAYPNGTRIVKAESEPGDMNPVGSPGVVLSSIDVSTVPVPEGIDRHVSYFYFVEWDSMPEVPVGISDWKIAKENA